MGIELRHHAPCSRRCPDFLATSGLNSRRISLSEPQDESKSPEVAGDSSGETTLERVRIPGAPSEEPWDVLSDQLDAFIEEWETSSAPPDLLKFIPAGSGSMQRFLLIELIKVDLEYRLSNASLKFKVEDYARQYPELLRDGQVPVDLLYEEYHVRCRAGEEVEIDEYRERFPSQAAAIERLIGKENHFQSTAFFKSKPNPKFCVGKRVDDFDLLIELGKGAFATVFLARQISLQRLVALKISADQGTEPQTLAQLDHPNIVRVYDQRILPQHDGRLLYMKYVAGGTLQNVISHSLEIDQENRDGSIVTQAVDMALDRSGQEIPLESLTREKLVNMSWPQTVTWFGIQLASALDYSHRLGVLHRDLKPANILLTSEGAPQIADFNISFCSKIDGATPAAYFGGSLAYMSPEQLEACNPNHDREPDSLAGQSDIYSLGVVLWEMLTGKRPFDDQPVGDHWGTTLNTMITARRTGPDLNRLEGSGNEELYGLQEALKHALEPQPEDRFRDGRQMAVELTLCLNHQVRRLMRPPKASWVHFIRRHLLFSILIVSLAPNILATMFNIGYNRYNIVEKFHGSAEVFLAVMTGVNLIAFPVGLFILVRYCWPLLKFWSERSKGMPGVPTESLFSLRKRALQVSFVTSMICIVEWTLAGLAFPIAMRAGGVDLGLGDFVHFVGSLALCGLIAAAYPFVGVTAMMVRAIYPPMLDFEDNAEADLKQLELVRSRSWVFFGLGFLVPMLAVLLMTLTNEQSNRIMLGILCGGSFLGSGVLLILARRLFHHIDILVELLETTKL